MRPIDGNGHVPADECPGQPAMCGCFARGYDQAISDLTMLILRKASDELNAALTKIESRQNPEPDAA